MATLLKLASSPEQDKYYGKSYKDLPEEDRKVFSKLFIDKQARAYYEPMWKEWNYAYQAVLFEYAFQRKFNDKVAPELQVRNLFSQNDRRLSDYRLPVEFAIIVRQIADEMSNLPKTRWVSLTQNLGTRDGKSRIFNYLYDWNYYEIDGDLETFKTLLAKAIYGTSIEYIFHEYADYKDFEPSGVKDGQVEWKQIQRVVSRPRFVNLDLRHFYVDANATDIREAGHSFMAMNYTKDAFDRLYPDGPRWDTKGVTCVGLNEMYANLGEVRRGMTLLGVQVIKYFDCLSNCVITYANGKRINRKGEHIPVPSLNGRPPLPFAVFYDSPVDKEFYALGKCAILKPFREVKNKLRNAFFDISKKMAFNTLVIDPASDFDEETFEFGQNFIRAVPDEVKPLPVSANLQPVIDLDNRTDQDMIWATGVNFLDVAQGAASETATKTAVRKESQVKIVELGLKYNTVDGFKRRSLLLKQLLRLHLKAAMVQKVVGEDSVPLQVKTPGVQVFRDKKKPFKLKEQRQQGFGLFTIRPEDMDEDVDLILEVGNIAATRELMKARQLEAMEFIKSLPPVPPGSQASYDQREVVKWAVEWGQLPPEVLPPGDKPLSDQSPQDVMKNLSLIDKPPTINDHIENQQAQQGQLPPTPGTTPPGMPVPGTQPQPGAQ